MSVEPEPADAVAAAEHVAESLVELCRRAREDVAPTVSDEQIRGLLTLDSEATAPGRMAVVLDISPSSARELLDGLGRRTLVRRLPSGEFCLTGAGKCVLEAVRQHRRRLLEQALVTAALQDRPVLRDAVDQLCGVVSPLDRVPRPRSPL
ncbi:hypothetical protein JK359_32280 [Streptomyces actinomycinicus]|uniref:Uncharacterized protein n=1 Tax=Streptomyces actinomycinicus TaxID=1695166 RepID=A0A937ERA6_9ACTN|nr:hypothetical protein [Streptomyces actinomycinicus]MBL1086584.1 hypothetical protein [Streptomyces actinomycinicus]